jgi:tetratricopeptide (TPR) repeat protein
MKTKLMYTMILVLCAFAGALTANAQTAHIKGRISDKDQPIAGAQVIYKSMNTGKIVKVKTDKNGEFFTIGVPDDVYTVTIVDATGKTIWTHDKIGVGEGGDDIDNILTVDLTNGVTVKTPKGASSGGFNGQQAEFHGGNNDGKNSETGTKKEASVSKEEMERLKAEHDKGLNINALIKQYQDAMSAKDQSDKSFQTSSASLKSKQDQASVDELKKLTEQHNAQVQQNWNDASTALKQMVTADPTHWEYFQALGGSEYSLQQYQESVDSYDKGIQVAQATVAGNGPKNGGAASDPAKAKAGIGQMLTAQGNSYLKLNKQKEAIASFTKAAEMDPNPGNAYFNLCATQYNTGNTDGALAACDKAIAADPNRAEAYFIKGSLMMGSSSMDKQGKLQAPPGTAEALNKYLEIDPSGSHAGDVKEMLAAIGAKITTTYNEKGKKK